MDAVKWRVGDLADIVIGSRRVSVVVVAVSDTDPDTYTVELRTRPARYPSWDARKKKRPRRRFVRRGYELFAPTTTPRP